METVLVVENKIRNTTSEVHMTPAGKFIIHRVNSETGQKESGFATSELSEVIRKHLL